MAEKVYTPEVVPDAGFPLEGSAVTAITTATQETANQTYGAKEMAEQSFPLKMVAKELLSTAINTISKKITKAFEFTKSGALQIGEYINGVSGDIRISPDGITARNNAGNTTFSLDGDTGNAIFTGDVRASTFTSDFFNVDERGNVRATSLELSTSRVTAFAGAQYQTFTTEAGAAIDGTTTRIALDRGTLVLILLNLSVDLNAATGSDFDGAAVLWLSDGSSVLTLQLVEGGRDATQGLYGASVLSSASLHYLGVLPAGIHDLSAWAGTAAGSTNLSVWIENVRFSIITLGNG